MTDQTGAMKLLQQTYYDGIDAGDMALAASALHPDIDWSHAQVWRHDDLGLGGEPHVQQHHGAAAIRTFLDGVKPHLAAAQIRHRITDLVIDGERGAFLGSVVSRTDDRSVPFLVWFELTDGLMSRYTLRPL